MLATLFLSQGTPMLLAGDEFGNSQQGNNNAYAQDNEVGWLDWSGLGADPGFHKSVREIIGLRKRIPLFGQTDGWRDVEWLRPGCVPVQSEDRFEDGAIGLVFASTQSVSSGEVHAVALLMNPTDDAVDFVLPQHDDRPGWRVAFSSAAAGRQSVADSSLAMPARSFVCLTSSD
jgi:glycogen operon protein